LYQISYILVKENVKKCDKISLKFIQKRITFVFTESYEHFAKKPKIPFSAMFFCPYDNLFIPEQHSR